jgi:hypothetical protein
MAQNGSVEAFLCAVNLAPVILQKQSGEEMAEVDDEDLIPDQTDSERDLDMFLCELPSDIINIHQLFANTLTATGWAARLPEDPKCSCRPVLWLVMPSDNRHCRVRNED